MTFGLQCDEATSVAILDRAAAGGITFLENPVVTSPIVGASRREQLDDALAAVDKGLDAGLKTRLNDLTREYRWGDDIR